MSQTKCLRLGFPVQIYTVVALSEHQHTDHERKVRFAT